MNVLYVNDYSIDHTFEGVTKGYDHAAHLWGYDYFRKVENACHVPVDQRFFNWQKRTQLYKAFGDIYQEIKIVNKREKIDFVIAANINLIWGLGYLKRFVQLPCLVGILHSIPHYRNRFFKFLLKQHLGGIDKIFCIAKKDYFYLKNCFGFNEEKLSYLPWAANPQDYVVNFSDHLLSTSTNRNYIISMGKSERDYQTLIEAFRQLSLPDMELHIYSGSNYCSKGKDKNVKIFREFVRFKNSLERYYYSYLVVIPLMRSDRTLGLTSMFDAMAMGKAFLMTRNPGIDIDIEKEEIGLWVEPYNVDDIKDKLSFLINNPGIVKRYGENGKAYLNSKYNYNMFCEGLHRSLQAILSK